MEIPEVWPSILLALAAWRTFQLLVNDDILDRPRRWLLRLGNDWEKDGDPVPPEYRVRWALFLTCPYCFGAWVAIAWWVAWEIDDYWTEVISIPFALSAGVIGLSKILSQEE